MSYRRHLMMGSDKIEYLEFDNSLESDFFSYHFGDTKQGSGVVQTFDITSNGAEEGRMFAFNTNGISAHKSAKALKHNKPNDIPAKTNVRESVTLEIEVIDATPSGDLPWTPISNNTSLVRIQYRKTMTASTGANITVTTSNFNTMFTKSDNKYRYTFEVNQISCMIVFLYAEAGTRVKYNVIANDTNHREPIGVTKEQLALVTEVPSGWTGLVSQMEGLKYCNIHTLKGDFNRLIMNALHPYNPIYGGKTRVLDSDAILRSNYASSTNKIVYLFPRYVGASRWIFRGARNILHCDFGWVENMYNNFSYREFTNDAGWSLVFRANSVITQSANNLTFKNGTIYVPASQVTAYQATSWVQNSTNLTIAAIGGPEWQAQFSTVEDPSHEYANVKMYSPELYDSYYEDYEDAKRIYNEAHNISN